MTEDKYPQEIRQELVTLEKYCRNVIGYIPLLSTAKEVKRVFSELDIDVVVSICGVTITVTDVSRMDQIWPILRWLAKRGHRQTEKRQLLSNYGYIKYTIGSLQLNIWLDSTEAAHCKFVQTGTKEVPVYELQCSKDGEKEKEE